MPKSMEREKLVNSRHAPVTVVERTKTLRVRDLEEAVSVVELSERGLANEEKCMKALLLDYHAHS